MAAVQALAMRRPENPDVVWKSYVSTTKIPTLAAPDKTGAEYTGPFLFTTLLDVCCKLPVSHGHSFTPMKGRGARHRLGPYSSSLDLTARLVAGKTFQMHTCT